MNILWGQSAEYSRRTWVSVLAQVWSVLIQGWYHTEHRVYHFCVKQIRCSYAKWRTGTGCNSDFHYGISYYTSRTNRRWGVFLFSFFSFLFCFWPVFLFWRTGQETPVEWDQMKEPEMIVNHHPLLSMCRAEHLPKTRRISDRFTQGANRMQSSVCSRKHIVFCWIIEDYAQ